MSYRKCCLIFVLIICLGLFLFGCGTQETATDDTANEEEAAEVEEPVAEEQTAADYGLTTLMIGTASPGGNWYTAGAKLAQAIQELPMFKEAAVGSGPGGGVSNVVAVNEGVDMQIGMTTADVQYLGYIGTKPDFEAECKNICIIGTVETMLWQMAVPKDSDITSIQQLSDKRINPGKIGWSDRAFAEKLFAQYDITFDSIAANGGVVQGLGFDDAAQMMQDGQLDCTMTKGGVMPFLINLATRPGIRFLSVEGPEVDALLAQENMKGWNKGVIKAGLYEGITEDVPTVSITTTLICNADLPDDVVYEITKCIYESGFEDEVFKSSVEKGFPDTTDLNVLAANATIPVHPGAAKYFEEQGIALP